MLFVHLCLKEIIECLEILHAPPFIAICIIENYIHWQMSMIQEGITLLIQPDQREGTHLGAQTSNLLCVMTTLFPRKEIRLALANEEKWCRSVEILDLTRDFSILCFAYFTLQVFFCIFSVRDKLTVIIYVILCSVKLIWLLVGTTYVHILCSKRRILAF